MQPPPRGCVLKHFGLGTLNKEGDAAASARLCVETIKMKEGSRKTYAAASARLCVETFTGELSSQVTCAAASARLCVETTYT